MQAAELHAEIAYLEAQFNPHKKNTLWTAILGSALIITGALVAIAGAVATPFLMPVGVGVMAGGGALVATGAAIVGVGFFKNKENQKSSKAFDEAQAVVSGIEEMAHSVKETFEGIDINEQPVILAFD